MTTEREMIQQLGESLLEATQLQNNLILTINSLRHNLELAKDAEKPIDNIIQNGLVASKAQRDMAQSAIDYGSRGKVINIDGAA